MNLLRLFRTGFFIASVFLIQNAHAADAHMALYSTKGTFEDVKDNVVFAINGLGLVINNTSHVGEMLERTGKDLGIGEPIYLKAEALEFCSATISRNMMEADPKNIVFCPFIITIYVLPKEPEKVYIAYRKPEIVGSPQSKKALKAVDQLLKGIVSEALK
ncbi:DUF302 domain-containing protein [Sulfurirhabdus autotrophica]|uniref:Uncharacterized protein DUF302 n=1 Tax=Sulfurirhabdus autotrophica TaxID=1706046 RepID=A0A4V2W254_9PROT|nr:DUF302 domain-containing protein [Sulfurirhabdus autotrophica]TCV86729.1 uncharacterized protein DUF302 [Sulfurirhabdus autotrophica]